MMQKASYYTTKHYVFNVQKQVFSYQKTAYYNCFYISFHCTQSSILA